MRIEKMINRLIKLGLSITFYGLKTFTKPLNKSGNGKLTLVTYHSIKAHEISKFAKHMDELVKSGKPVPADMAGPFEQGKHFIAVTFDDGFQSFVHHALPVMLDKGVPATVFVTTGYLGKRAGWITSENHRNFDELVMTKEQISELGRLNVLVGSHSVTHSHLTRIDRAKVPYELENSKRELEEIVGKEVNLFSFPYGSYSDKVISLSKEAGYDRVFLNVPRKRGKDLDDYVFGRIDVSLNDWPIEYKLKFRGAYEWLCYIVMTKNKFKTAFRRGCSLSGYREVDGE